MYMGTLFPLAICATPGAPHDGAVALSWQNCDPGECVLCSGTTCTAVGTGNEPMTRRIARPGGMPES
jgi:hypothetical protein